MTPAPAEVPTSPARVPVYAAGPGDPTLPVETLFAAGWDHFEDEYCNTTFVSPDGRVTAEFGPETERYRRNPRTALWQVTYTSADPYRRIGWTASFGDEVPAEAIAAFLTALIHPDGLDPDRA